MIKLEGSIIINRPVDQIFNFMVDLENAPQWQTGVLEGEKLTDGPFQVGTRFREVIKLMGRRVEAICEIIEYMPSKKVAWRTVTSTIMSYEGQFTFEPVDGGTRINYKATAQLKGLWRLLQPLAAMEAKGEAAAEMNKLKSVLEVQPHMAVQLAR